MMYCSQRFYLTSLVRKKPSRFKLFLPVLLLFCSRVFAYDLVVGVNESVIQSRPETVSKIKQALGSTGLNIQFIEMPGERAIRELAEGNIDFDIYRQKDAVIKIENIIQISPPIETLDLHLFTHAEKKSLCTLSKKELKKFSVAGIYGARLYENFVYPLFQSSTKVVDAKQVASLVALNRVDFGVGHSASVYHVAKKAGVDIYVCEEKPLISLEFSSYIHVRRANLIPLIEKAYQGFFSKKGS